MRTKSAADIKGKWSRIKDDYPREGTEIRKFYDLFQSNKGVILDTTFGERRDILRQLTDAYGLDIRNLGYRKWCLVGEWFGKIYIDYLAGKYK